MASSPGNDASTALSPGDDGEVPFTGIFDNSGDGPLRVPGLNGVPLNYCMPLEERYYKWGEWQQTPLITAQEQAMVAVMEWLTDKPKWFEDVFDDAVVKEWRAELDRDRERQREAGTHFIANPRLMRSDATWDWCVQELRDKAGYYKKHGHIRVLDTGSCVCKADSAELQAIGAALREAVKPLAQEHNQLKAKVARLPLFGEPRSQAFAMWNGERLNPGTARKYIYCPEPPMSAAARMQLNREEELQRMDFQECQDSDDERPGHRDFQYPPIVWVPTYGDDENVFEIIKESKRLEEMETNDNSPQCQDGDVDRSPQSHDSPRGWTWIKPKPVSINDTSADTMISAFRRVSYLVDPRLHPLVFGRTPVLQEGGAVSLKDLFALRDDARISPIRPGLLPECTGKFDICRQHLPCEVAFVGGGNGRDSDDSDRNNFDVKITSYINGVHPVHNADLHQAIERSVGHAIRLWNDCLIHHKQCRLQVSTKQHTPGQSGILPARIVTFGVEWDNELLGWAAAFRVPTSGATNDFSLPANDSDLWKCAEDYLRQPIPGQELNENAISYTIGEDGIVGNGNTWDMLYEKARRWVCHRHPEPGTMFSYEDWKLGRHESEPIIRPVLHPPTSGIAREWRKSRRAERRRRQREEEAGTLLGPPLPFSPLLSESLQDRFREQGLQVLVEICSVELTTEAPAYAAGAAIRHATYARETAVRFASAVENNAAVNLDDRPFDYDGWRLFPASNEHMVAMAVVAFDVENVTEPRIEFRQRRETQVEMLYCIDDCLHDRARGSKEKPNYDLKVDGHPKLIGKENDVGAMAEIVGIPTAHFYGEDPVLSACQSGKYQSVGSVALTPSGRMVAFPTVMEHRLRPFRLVDETKSGHLRWMTLYLVDPHYRVCSTRNVLPQQHEWWLEIARREMQTVAESSRPPQQARDDMCDSQVPDDIRDSTNSWSMGMDEALWHRDNGTRDFLESEDDSSIIYGN